MTAISLYNYYLRLREGVFVSQLALTMQESQFDDCACYGKLLFRALCNSAWK